MKDTNSKRTQRTPSEIIAETEAKLERLRIKQAKKDASSNPDVAVMLENKAEIQKQIREAKKILGNGPQSGQARIAKHERWIDKINAEIYDAEDILSTGEQRLSEIDARIQAKISTIVKNFEANA
jgi:Na+-translocating ferredoxin:NAD+ oxidoreductase RnfC subunit